MSNESLKSRVLAECERLNGVEDTPHPFVIRFVDAPLMVGYGFFADGRNIFSIQPQVLPNAVNWILASRLLCLPEEGKQQPEQLEINLAAIIEQLESCEYRCVAGPLELNTAFIALKAFAESFTPAPSPQPLVDALKTGIKELEGQFEIIKNLRDWLMQVEENPSVGDLLEMIGYSRSGHNERLDKYNGLILMESSLKDWEGKQ